MQLLWEQQKVLCKKDTKKYHPIIHFCISLVSRSPSAYDELRDSNILVLLKCRTLRDYKYAITPKTDFNSEIIEELRNH